MKILQWMVACVFWVMGALGASALPSFSENMNMPGSSLQTQDFLVKVQHHWQERKRERELAAKRAREEAFKRKKRHRKKKNVAKILGGALAAGIGAIILNELANADDANAGEPHDDRVTNPRLNMCRSLFMECDDGTGKASDRACERYERRCH